MNFPKETCCLCLTVSNGPFYPILSKSENDLTYSQKISTTLTLLGNLIMPDMDFMICKICCKTIEMIYSYNENSLKNITILSNYKKKLKSDGTIIIKSIKKVDSTISVSSERSFNCTFEDKPKEGNSSESLIVKEESSDGKNYANNISNEIDAIEMEEIDIKEDYFTEINDDSDFQGMMDGENSLEIEDFPSLLSVETITLPEKSKNNYMKDYTNFKDWLQKNNITDNISEEIMLKYFQEKASQKKVSTLWAMYSKLRATLAIEDNIDISKFMKLRTFLKRITKNQPKPNKASVFTKEEIDRFLIEAPDDHYLSKKAIMVIGVSCGIYMDALSKMHYEDLDVRDDAIIINIPNTISGPNVAKRYYIDDLLWVSVVKKYLDNRPADMKKLFIMYRDGKHVRQNIGHNTIGRVPYTVAQYLQLNNPSSYTGHSLKRSSAMLRGSSGFSRIIS